MKTILLFSILLCAIALPVLGQAPQQNSVETDIAVIKAEIKHLRETMETGFANINDKFATVDGKFATVDGKFATVNDRFDTVDSRFDTVEKNFDRLNNIIIACIGIPLAILAIGATLWGILSHRRSIRDSTLEKQVEILTQEIETLKQQRIVNP